MNELPKISKQTFWDVEISEIDWEKNAEWIIERVFDRGSLQEVLDVNKFYGKDFVKKMITEIPTFIPNHSILLAMTIFNIKFDNFKCLEKRPFLMSY